MPPVHPQKEVLDVPPHNHHRIFVPYNANYWHRLLCFILYHVQCPKEHLTADQYPLCPPGVPLFQEDPSIRKFTDKTIYHKVVVANDPLSLDVGLQQQLNWFRLSEVARLRPDTRLEIKIKISRVVLMTKSSSQKCSYEIQMSASLLTSMGHLPGHWVPILYNGEVLSAEISTGWDVEPINVASLEEVMKWWNDSICWVTVMNALRYKAFLRYDNLGHVRPYNDYPHRLDHTNLPFRSQMCDIARRFSTWRFHNHMVDS